MRRRGAPRRRCAAAGGRLGSQPLQLPAVPLGQHRGEHELRRVPGGGGGEMRDDHLAGDPVGHLIAASADPIAMRGRGTGGPARPVRAEPRQLQRRRPPRQLRRHHGGGGSSGPRSLITTVPAKTSPIRLPFGDSRLQITAGPPEERPDLDEAGQPAKQRLAEPFRAAVVGNHPQSQRHLAQRLAAGGASRRSPGSRATPAP